MKSFESILNMNVNRIVFLIIYIREIFQDIYFLFDFNIFEYYRSF